MLSSDIRNQVDAIWNAFWTGGISNPMEVLEQITYLLFIRRLDDAHTLEESKALVLRQPMSTRIFPEGKDSLGRDFNDLRWSHFKNFTPSEMFTVVAEHVFPFMRNRGGDGSTYSQHMKDARFTIPTPGLLAKVVDMLDRVPMEDRDTKGDLYEYMLSKIASAGQNGQFRTPRHIIKFMVELTTPMPKDVICDPASGTCGFLVAAGEYLREKHLALFNDTPTRAHFHDGMFHGYDFDNTMLRIGSMNMALHGVDNPDIRYKDSLAQDHADDEEKYSLILANPPFSGSLDYESTARDLLSIVRTRKTELLFMALFFRLLTPGGRAAVIVPTGVIESDSLAHQTIRRKLIDEFNLEAVISLPHWVFKPYASVATAILIFKKSSTTEKVFFYRVENDGYSNDANKTPCDGSELPSVLDIFSKIKIGNYTEQIKKHRLVDVNEIRENNYDLCDRIYLTGYDYPKGVSLKEIGDLFYIERGSTGAANADGGQFPLITTSEELKSHSVWTFDTEAICIPTVSSTGHGHASIKRIHYIKGKFSAATITLVLTAKDSESLYLPYIYYYLQAHKDELLVPLMRGSANVSLNEERLSKLKIPVPHIDEQKNLVKNILESEKNVAKYKLLTSDAIKELETAVLKLKNSF